MDAGSHHKTKEQVSVLNGEPELAEVHYMPDNLEDTQEYFEQIQLPNLRWSFTINHAHFDPIGIKGFVEGMDMRLCEEVRVADNNGEYEIHMKPGTGNVDFGEMFVNAWQRRRRGGCRACRNLCRASFSNMSMFS